MGENPTGMAEIMGDFTFEYISEHCALFTGQLKARGTEREAYLILLLAPFLVIKAGLDALRAKQAAQALCDKVGDRYHGAMTRCLCATYRACMCDSYCV